MELRFSPLFSGSSGNSTYVGCDDAQLLVDAGIPEEQIAIKTGQLDEKTNGQDFFGPPAGDIIFEQQLSGHSWYGCCLW